MCDELLQKARFRFAAYLHRGYKIYRHYFFCSQDDDKNLDINFSAWF